MKLEEMKENNRVISFVEIRQRYYLPPRECLVDSMKFITMVWEQFDFGD